jgi:hypothetical protein
MQGIKGKKNGYIETEETGEFWICKAIEIDTRLRIGSVVDKEEGDAGKKLLSKLKERGHPDKPPALSTDGRGGCKEGIKELWGEKILPNCKYLQIIKQKTPEEGTQVKTKVIYGNEDILDYLGDNLSYIDRTHLTSRQMNGRLVRKTLSFSKKGRFLEASCVFEDWVYNLVRIVRTLRFQENNKWKYISPAMKAGITDHLWTIEELLKTIVVPST